jgi:threonine dehydratase
VALAPLLAGEYGGKAGRKAGVIVSGGNVDPEILGKLGEASSSSRCGPS